MRAASLNNAFARFQATCLIVCSGVLYGFLGYFGTRLLNHHFSVFSMLFWRFFIAAVWMVCAARIMKQKRLVPFKRVSHYLLILFSVLVYSISSALYFVASRSVGTGPAMVVFFSFPIFVALIGIATGRSFVNRYTMMALLAVMGGLLLLKGHGVTSMSLYGLLLALTAAIMYALYVYVNQDSGHVFASDQFTLMICGGSALFFLMLCLINQQMTLPVTGNDWLAILALGTLATAIPIQMFLVGLKTINPVKASILSVLEPAITLLVGALVLNESITTLQMVGVMIIITSAIVAQLAPNR